ncbi:MAG: hypothetical protein AAGJ40_08140 [Planctomycetota bacterium]
MLFDSGAFPTQLPITPQDLPALNRQPSSQISHFYIIDNDINVLDVPGGLL